MRSGCRRFAANHATSLFYTAQLPFLLAGNRQGRKFVNDLPVGALLLRLCRQRRYVRFFLFLSTHGGKDVASTLNVKRRKNRPKELFSTTKSTKAMKKNFFPSFAIFVPFVVKVSSPQCTASLQFVFFLAFAANL
jgi:hypothetical protein